jgi:ferrous iron transport protein B
MNHSTNNNQSIPPRSALTLQAEIAARDDLAARYAPRWLALKLLEGDAPLLEALRQEPGNAALLAQAARLSAELAAQTGQELETQIADERYGWITQLAQEVVQRAGDGLTLSEKIDRFVTHRWLGLPIFLLVMFVLFRLTSELPAPYVNWLDSVLSGPLARWSTALLSWLGLGGSWVENLLLGGVLPGVGGVLAFVPVLAALYLGLGLLEDSGYMARAAFVVDRLMHFLGLHGKSFLPMIVGFGCSVPGIYATRTMENPRERILTGMLVPFMSCGTPAGVCAADSSLFPAPGRAGDLWPVPGRDRDGCIDRPAAQPHAVPGHATGRADPGAAALPSPGVEEHRPPDLGAHRRLRAQSRHNHPGMQPDPVAADGHPGARQWALQRHSGGRQPVRGGFAMECAAARAAGLWQLAVEWGADHGRGGQRSGGQQPGASLPGRPVSATARARSRWGRMWPGSRGFGEATLARRWAACRLLGIDWRAGQPPGVDHPGCCHATQLCQSSGGHASRALAFVAFALLYTPCISALVAERQELGTRWMLLNAFGQLGIAWLAGWLVFRAAVILGG